MITTYEEALDWIHNRLRFGIKPGLERMEWMLEQLDFPQQNLNAIHVAGTNGKGSTVSYLRNMLEEAGYKVGTFTSPYIETFNERISVNGKPISNEAMTALVQEIKPVVERLEHTNLGSATEFEVITVMAFLYFGYHESVDYAVFETGLGGRYDSTNVVNPMVSIITNIGFDHMAILGDTVEEIAAEKAGIIKKEVPIITGAEQVKALDVITEEAKSKQASLFVLGKDFDIKNYEPLANGEGFALKTPYGTFEHLELNMLGYHQVKNAALAVMAVCYLKEKKKLSISNEQMIKGIQHTKWNGRFEIVNEHPLTIIDGAHNAEGIDSLLSTLRLHYEDRNIHLVFSCLNDKSADRMVQELETIAASITFTSFDFPRARAAQELYEMSTHHNKHMDEEWKEAIAYVKEKATGEQDMVVITGSLYFISEVRAFLLK